MKKLVTLIVSAVLAISVFAFAGCSDSTFEGNYTAATAEDLNQVQAVLPSMNLPMAGYAEGAGLEISMKMENKETRTITNPDQTQTIRESEDTIDFSMQMATNGGKTVSASEVSIYNYGKETTGEKSNFSEMLMEGTVYTDGAFMYTEGKSEMKDDYNEQYYYGKDRDASTDLNDALDEFGVSMYVSPMMIQGIIMMSSQVQGLAISMDKTDAAAYKLKIEFTEDTFKAMNALQGSTVDEGSLEFGEYYIIVIFNPTNGQIIAYTMQAEVSYTTGAGAYKTEMKMSLTVKAFNGTVDMPSAEDLAKEYPVD